MPNPIGRIKATKNAGTEVMHSGSQKLLYRMDAKLNVFDAEMLRQMTDLAYSAGIAAGEQKLQSELKQLLGIEVEGVG